MSGVRLLLEAARWLTGLWLLWSVPGCRRDGAGGEDLEDVSVVVPARDEEPTLPTLLASLAAQDPPPGEVLVADDHSVDDTAGVAGRAGVAVIACPPLPEGWTGKAWACWTGANAARGATLVFLDADTELAPGGLARLVAEQRAYGGLLSVQPFHVTRRAHEQLSALFNVVAMMGVAAFTPLGRRARRAGAFGPCLVCRRRDYEAVGGHEAVRGQVIEDVALSRRFLRAGLPVTCLGGRGTVDFRMYPGGLGQVVEGWSKNFAAGAGGTPPLAFLLVSVWLSGCISAAGHLAGVGGMAPAAALALYAAYAAQLRWMLARIGRFAWWSAALFPVPLAFFLAVFARSLALTHLRGEVRWRGRRIPTGAGARRRPARTG